MSLYAGNVPVNYGNELSGVAALETLSPVQKQTTNLNVSIGGVGGLAEFPVGQGGGINVGTALSDTTLVLEMNPSALSFHTAPRSAEVFVSGEFTPAGTLDTQFVGYEKNSDSSINIVSPSFSGRFDESVRTSFAAERLKGITSSGWEWKASVGGGSQKRDESIGALVISDQSNYGAFATDWTRTLSDTVAFGFGADALFNHGGIEGSVPATASFSPAAPAIPLDYFRTDSQLSGYLSLNWRPVHHAEVSIGARSDSFLGQPGGTAISTAAFRRVAF